MSLSASTSANPVKNHVRLWWCRCVAALLALLTGFSALAESPEETFGLVTVCAEDAGWPPYSIPPATETDAFDGYNKSLLDRMFRDQGVDYRVVIRPWKRCLQDAISGDVTLVMDAAKNPQRAETYLLTDVIYDLTPIAFFPAQRERTLDERIEPSSLAGLVVCGQNGYTYRNFGVSEESVERVSEDLYRVLDLVAIGRCDAGLARLEVMLYNLRDYDKVQQLVWRPMAGSNQESFYWMINRSYPHAEALKAWIDWSLQGMKERGETKVLLQPWLR